MEYKFIDMHCHILPGVDDGAQNIAETRAMLKMAYDEGIRLIIATPHHHERRGHATPEQLRTALIAARREAQQISPELEIYLGCEVYWGHEIPDKLRSGQVLTMNQTRTVLVEFSPGDEYDRIRRAVQRLQMSGYDVIIAHAERYECLLDDWDLASELYDMGAQIQINAGSILGDMGRSAKKFVRWLMEENMVFGVGTDCHDTKKRAPRMKKAAHKVMRRYGEKYMKKIFFDNPLELLEMREER